MSHPSYSAEICDGLDNDCDGMVTDNGGDALCLLANAVESCGGRQRAAQVASCEGRLPEPGPGQRGWLRVPARGLDRQGCAAAVSAGGSIDALTGPDHHHRQPGHHHGR
ncbi:MAG: putative metal-binding motif-containing protein [Sandaracinaceae bacterium]|nr:putative metal-binding motif-containing protein [Sandaracinaceae bacterium]